MKKFIETLQAILPFMKNPDDYAPGGGGMPIVLKGTGVIGSVCVSGEPNHLDDQAIVTQALRQLKAEKEA